ncbi:S-adenosyl-L-methionine-dependent methyltransferase, partial [Stachybotrys elegans]
VRWLCHFNIPTALPLNKAQTDQDAAIKTSPLYEARTYTQVANDMQVPEDHLRRIARMAMLTGFLAEPTPGQLCHTPLSAAIATQPQLLEWARFITSFSAPMVSHMVEATERWEGAPGEDRTAYNAAWNTDKPVFRHLAEHPKLLAALASYMRASAQSEGLTVRHLIECWRPGWEALAARQGVLVDVGGSAGHVSIALAQAFPGLRAVVQDRPEVIRRAQEGMTFSVQGGSIPVVLQAHDFFTAQPERPEGWECSGKGDVYLVRQVLHDWDDDKAILILSHLFHALRASGPDARLLLMDTILPTPGAGSRTEEGRLRVRDLTMLQSHNSHERSETQLTDLLLAAHPSMKIKQIVQPFNSLLGVIEVGLE